MTHTFKSEELKEYCFSDFYDTITIVGTTQDFREEMHSDYSPFTSIQEFVRFLKNNLNSQKTYFVVLINLDSPVLSEVTIDKFKDLIVAKKLYNFLVIGREANELLRSALDKIKTDEAQLLLRVDKDKVKDFPPREVSVLPNPTSLGWNNLSKVSELSRVLVQASVI